MPIDYSSAVKQIEDGKTASEVLYTLQTFFSDYEFCLHNLSVLSPLTEKLRENPYSASALNDFAYALEHMDASVYDAFMRQPENKDVIELYKKTDRGTEEYRKALYGELCAKGRSIISGFEKETGISLNSLSFESRKVYRIIKKLVEEASRYALNRAARGDDRTFTDLINHYENTVIKKYEQKFYLPARQKSVEALQKLHQYLIDKSQISDEQAEKWYNQNVEIDNGVFKLAAKEGWTKKKLKEYLKGLYRLVNGLDFRKLSISIKSLGRRTLGNASINGDKFEINLAKSKRFDISTLTHEFGHCADYCIGGNISSIHQFFKDRSDGKTGELVEYEGEGYIDKFYKSYVGRVYPGQQLTECISTGIEQITTTINEYDLFEAYGYKYQAYDPEHLAITIGSFHMAKGIGSGSMGREYTAANTAIAREWLKAVENSIPAPIHEQISKGKYSHKKFDIEERPNGIYVKTSRERDWWRWPEIKSADMPLVTYIIWGYLNKEFPFEAFHDFKLTTKKLDRAARTNKVYVPFWYTIGMKLPEMR